MYSKASLISFRAAIQRQLTEHQSTINVMTNKEFQKANIALNAFIKKMKQDGNLKEVNHKDAIYHEDQTKLNSYFLANYETDPITLAEMVWFPITKQFCLRGREFQSDTCAEVFEVCHDTEFGEYIRMKNSMKSKNHQRSMDTSDSVSDGRIVNPAHVKASCHKYSKPIVTN